MSAGLLQVIGEVTNRKLILTFFYAIMQFVASVGINQRILNQKRKIGTNTKISEKDMNRIPAKIKNKR
jgi:hypothetical protein